MNISQVEEKVKALVGNIDQAEFLFNLLDCYGKPKASITRLKIAGKGSYNLSKQADEVLWKKQVYFKATESDQLLSVIDEMKHAESVTKHQPRFIIAINSTHLLAIDTKTQDTLDIPIVELNKKFDFFLPWAGLEKAQAQSENPADVKAAEKMAKLFDLLRDNNPADTAQEIHAQNVFLSRILFCYFAEDTGIFEPKLFTNHVASHTTEDGADLDDYLRKVFDVMNQEHRKGLPAYLTDFPYVNGGLFADKLAVPKFNRKSRAMLIECGSDLNWSEINPDIFGSMIQAVVDPSQRGNMGMHYTSVPNIMKVIEPLFLNELKEEFEKHSDNKAKLEQLLLRLEHLKIFDPACGSGNFLIIAYREIRQLEMELFKRLQELSKEGMFPLSRIKLSQFYGIELDDFAHEIAILSLWLAEHQMNLKFKATFGHANPALPLKSSANVICRNAIQMDWATLVPRTTHDEIYLIGNPPYIGASLQSEEQKADIEAVFVGIHDDRKVDYIACWFIKAAQFIRTGGKFSFVTTNSVNQGIQATIIWKPILGWNLEIFFAHKSFPWSNNAKNNAGVIVSIIGVQAKTTSTKILFLDGFEHPVSNINAYLVSADNVFVESPNNPINEFPKLIFGNKPIDYGHLILSDEEMQAIVFDFPNSNRLFKRLYGSQEFIKGVIRWCIWIDNEADLTLARNTPPISQRIDSVRHERLKGTGVAKSCANRPHQFCMTRRPESSMIIIPEVSTERRKYIPMGFLDNNAIPSNKALVIFDPQLWIFGLLTSLMHMVWVKSITGRLGNGLSYSAGICYNSFPLPTLGDQDKRRLEELSLEILAARETYSERSMSELYDPDEMPTELSHAHHRLDMAVDAMYAKGEFKSDEDRIRTLFKLYEKMTGVAHA